MSSVRGKEAGQERLHHAGLVSSTGGTIAGSKIDPGRIDYGIILGWLAFCQARHIKLCHRPNDGAVTRNLRVIDCLTRNILPIPSEETYVTLSYIWGPSATSSSSGAADDTQLPDSIPRVIHDAMAVTTKLGFAFSGSTGTAFPRTTPARNTPK